jgi:hypothetical protein
MNRHRNNPCTTRVVLSLDELGAILAAEHLVTVKDNGKRIECQPWCQGAAPHLSEFRAADVNPNR